MRSGGRVVEGARLESEYTAKPYRGFESLPLRQIHVQRYAPLSFYLGSSRRMCGHLIHGRPLTVADIRAKMWGQTWGTGMGKLSPTQVKAISAPGRYVD